MHVFRAADLLRFDVGVPLLRDLCMQNATCSEDELVGIAIFILEEGVKISCFQSCYVWLKKRKVSLKYNFFCSWMLWIKIWGIY